MIRRTLAWSLLAAGLVLSAYAGLQVKHSLERDRLHELELTADRAAVKVRERLAAYELILRGASAMFSISPQISRQQWQRYVAQVEADRIVPGVQGIGFAQLIPPGGLAEHTAVIRRQGFPDYQVRPAGERPLMSSIVYLEPFRDRNLQAFGYDMLSEAVRRAAMLQARDSGRSTLSGKVRLVQEDGTQEQVGTLMYVPVYRHGVDPGNAAARRDALIGWAYMPFRMKDLMHGILNGLAELEGKQVVLHYYQGDSPHPDQLLFHSGPRATLPPDAVSVTRTLDFHGQGRLLVVSRIGSPSPAAYAPALLVLLGGWLLTGLAFGFAMSLLRTRERAQVIAEELTAQIRQHERWLAESKARLSFAVDGSGLGVWDWTLSDDTVYFSSFGKRMLGYEEDELSDSPATWFAHTHPDDLETTRKALQDCLDRVTPYFDHDHRMRCKDGSYKWIRDRAMVTDRDVNGKALRIIGTYSDISEKKQLEIEKEEYYKFFVLSSEPMCIADPFGAFKRVNPAMLQLLGYEEHDLLARPFMDFVHPDDRERTQAEMEQQVGKRPSLRFQNRYLCRDGSERFLSWIAFYDPTAEVTYATARDITESRRVEQQIHRLTQLYAALSQCNAAVVRCRTQADLFARICQIVVNHGGMDLAWIGLTEPATGRVLVTAAHGSGTDYLDDLDITVTPNDPHSQGPTGRAIRENSPYWLEDFMGSDITRPWHQRAAAYGWQASAALPLRRNGQAIGSLTLYSREHAKFDDTERRLLTEMADNVSYALDTFEAEQLSHSYHATLLESEQRFRGMIEQSIAGVFILRDGRLEYLNPRCAHILGYAHPDDLLGKSLLNIVAPKDRRQFKQEIELLNNGSVANATPVFSALRQDRTNVEVGVNITLASYQGHPAMIGLMQDISDKQVAQAHISRYASQLQSIFMQTVGLATTLSEMRDPYTAGHEHRVGEIAVAIGRSMGLGPEQLEGLRVGGYLHDVGKIIVPTEILVKPGKLSAYEFALIKQHPQAGYEVLKDVAFPWPVAEIAQQHHERIDGSGYPQGLKGDEIILEARITAVADVIESMASHRPYRAGLGIDAALEEIERGMGTMYDVEVARTTLKLFREQGYVLPQ